MKPLIPFFTLVRQEVYRFWRLIKQTIFPPIVTTLLYILIFGFSLGSRIQEIHGFPYILFIIPGLAAMGVINGSFSNACSSLYMAKFDRSLENLLATPLRPVEMVLAYIFSGLMRGVLIGTLILIVALSFFKIPPQHFFVLLYFFIFQSVIFSCWGIIAGMRAKTWDSLATIENFIITPLVYLGGVFYSIDLLPQPWRMVSMFNPLFYIMDGTRYGILGVHDAPLLYSFSFTAIVALILFGVCVYLFQIGYRMVR